MTTLHISHPTLSLQEAEHICASIGIHRSIRQVTSGYFRLDVNTAEASAVKSRLRDEAIRTRVDIALTDAYLQAGSIKLLAMDMDSTLITIECIDEIADFIGKKKEVSEITEAAMRGEITNFSESLNRRVALLKGVPESALESVYEQRLRLSPGAENLIDFAKQSGWKTLLVSGGFTFFTEKLKSRLGLDQTHANTLEVEDGVLTGRVLGQIVDGDYKRKAVENVCGELGCPTSAAVCIGDGANDLPMMNIAGASVAFRAKPTVQAQTTFQINHGGLDTLVKWLS